MTSAAFILTSETNAAAYYRLHANVEAFGREGVEVTPLVLPHTQRGRREIFRRAGRYDVVVLQRKLLMPLQFNELRRSARVLGYDFDDALPFRPNGGRSPGRALRFRWMMRGVDFVTAGNEYLAKLAGRAGRNVFIVPTPVDTSVYAPRAREEGPVRLGWIGSASTVGYLEEITPALERIAAARRGVTLTVVSDAFPRPRPFIREVVWSRASEASEVASFDIGLMPLPDNRWTRGKCGFKLLLYGAVGAASVASPVGANAEVIGEGETGLFAATPGEWESALLRLIDDAALRARMGRAARGRVESLYSTAAVVPKWAGILRRMADRTSAPV